MGTCVAFNSVSFALRTLVHPIVIRSNRHFSSCVSTSGVLQPPSKTVFCEDEVVGEEATTEKRRCGFESWSLRAGGSPSRFHLSQLRVQARQTACPGEPSCLEILLSHY